MIAPKIRLLTTISSLYAVRKREQAFRVVKRAVQKKSYPIRSISEIFIHLSLFLGYPAMLDGLERLALLKGPRKSGSATPQRREGNAEKGVRILRRIYGKQSIKLISRLDGLESGLGSRITEDAYGAIMGRPGLPLADRELINVVILFIDGFEPQLYSHLRGSMRVGVTSSTLRSALLLAARITGKDPSRAIEILNRVSRNPGKGSF